MKYRYTLHYINTKGKSFWEDDYKSTHESLDFKTKSEALEYLSILKPEDKAYIVDNVTKNKITNEN